MTDFPHEGLDNVSGLAQDIEHGRISMVPPTWGGSMMPRWGPVNSDGHNTHDGPQPPIYNIPPAEHEGLRGWAAYIFYIETAMGPSERRDEIIPMRCDAEFRAKMGEPAVATQIWPQ